MLSHGDLLILNLIERIHLCCLHLFHFFSFLVLFIQYNLYRVLVNKSASVHTVFGAGIKLSWRQSVLCILFHTIHSFKLETRFVAYPDCLVLASIALQSIIMQCHLHLSLLFRAIFLWFTDATISCSCGISAQRVDDEDDEIVVHDQDVQRLVIVTRVSPLNYKIVNFKMLF